MSRKPDPKTAEQKKLIKKIRKTKRYISWKKSVLFKEGWDPKDKNIQIHHTPEISKILNDYKIKTIDEALQCKFLWELERGITLTRGEHWLFTKLSRFKYLTEGFIRILENWLNECKNRPRKISTYRKSL